MKWRMFRHPLNLSGPEAGSLFHYGEKRDEVIR
jgi:hypothetical protein